MIDTRDEHLLLAVHATPGARRNAVGGEFDGALRVKVTQAAEKGKANDAVLDVLAETLGIRRSQLQLVGGQTHRRKTVRIDGVPETTLRQTLANLR